jgi:hypothetical protein
MTLLFIPLSVKIWMSLLVITGLIFYGATRQKPVEEMDELFNDDKLHSI